MNNKILVIDDDPLILMIHEAVLETQKLNSCLEFFDDASKAISFMQSDKNQHCKFLLLLDINMPIVSGWDLLDEIEDSELKPRIDVVMVTSSVNDGDKIKANKYQSVIDFISKPLKENDLEKLKKIEKLKPFFHC